MSAGAILISDDLVLLRTLIGYARGHLNGPSEPNEYNQSVEKGNSSAFSQQPYMCDKFVY